MEKEEIKVWKNRSSWNHSWSCFSMLKCSFSLASGHTIQRKKVSRTLWFEAILTFSASASNFFFISKNVVLVSEMGGVCVLNLVFVCISCIVWVFVCCLYAYRRYRLLAPYDNPQSICINMLYLLLSSVLCRYGYTNICLKTYVWNLREHKNGTPKLSWWQHSHDIVYPWV